MPIKRKLIKNGYLNSLDWNNIEVYYIVSTGRTATKFLAHFLNNYDNNILALHEPRPHIGKLRLKYFTNSISHKQTLNILDYYRTRYAYKINKRNIKLYIESDWQASYLIPVLNDLFNNVSYIWVIRNGIDFVRSAYSKKMPQQKNTPYVYSANDKSFQLTPKLFANNPYANVWDTWDRFSKICWYWTTLNSIIEKDLTKNTKSRYIQVKYEDIFQDSTHQGLKDIIQFIGLPKNEKSISAALMNKVNKTDSFKLPDNFSDWPPMYRENFTTLCGKAMEKYGYKY